VAARAVLLIVRGDAEVVLGRVNVAQADLALVDALARLQLAARRLGCSVGLRNVSADLYRLLALAGLAESGLRIEPRREAEGPE
jgi:anti-anti-sigma regulatory factor